MIKQSGSSLRKVLGNLILERNYPQLKHCSSVSQSDHEKEKEIERIKMDASLDEPPTSCCQSGCSNCVFIVWAEALAAKMEKNPEIATKILNLVEDPSMKAYLEMELRIRGLTK